MKELSNGIGKSRLTGAGGRLGKPLLKALALKQKPRREDQRENYACILPTLVSDRVASDRQFGRPAPYRGENAVGAGLCIGIRGVRIARSLCRSWRRLGPRLEGQDLCRISGPSGRPTLPACGQRMLILVAAARLRKKPAALAPTRRPSA